MSETERLKTDEGPAESVLMKLLGSFIDVSTPEQTKQDEERWLRQIDPKCWISALYRLTGFGWYEWETAIVFINDTGDRQPTWEDRDCLIISGDRRKELATMPKEQLRQWYDDNIDGNRNSKKE